jgi:toxin ParE1/3/4
MAQIKGIHWTTLALEDLGRAYDYIARDRPSAARNIILQLERALTSLVHFPYMGRIGRVSNTRELYLPNTPFILAYRLRKELIEIVGFIHAARRWPESFA